MRIHRFVVVLPPVEQQPVAHLLQHRVPEAGQAQEWHHVEQGVLSIWSLIRIAFDEQFVGVGQRLERILQHVFGARAVAGRPQVFGERDQRVHRLIAVATNHIEGIDAHRVVRIRQVDQHHAVPLARREQPTERVDDIAVRLDEGQAGSRRLVHTSTRQAEGLSQVLEECALALAGTGYCQEVVTQALRWQVDRHSVPGVARRAYSPPLAECQLARSKRCAGAGAFHIREVGEVMSLRQVPERREVSHTQPMR